MELEDEDTHCRLEALVVTPEQTGQLTESQTEMALLLQGKSWTDTGSIALRWKPGRFACAGLSAAWSRKGALPSPGERALTQ